MTERTSRTLTEDATSYLQELVDEVSGTMKQTAEGVLRRNRVTKAEADLLGLNWEALPNHATDRHDRVDERLDHNAEDDVVAHEPWHGDMHR